MPLYQAQNMFNGGEISPLLYARYDQPRYQSGACRMCNMVPLPHGGATRRPGMMHCGQAKEQTAPVRLVPFLRAAKVARMLEFGPGYMRVWRANGTQITTTAGAPYTLTIPYTAADIGELTFAQSADVVFIASKNHPPAKISRYGDTDWRYAALTFKPSVPAPGKPTLAAGGSNAGTGSKTYSYVVTAIDPETGQMSAPSEAADISASTLSTTYYIDIRWAAVAGVKEYRVYKKDAGVYGFVGRALDGAISFQDANIKADSGDTAPNIKTPFIDDGNYPAHVFFHQQRLGWASTASRPLTVWLSQSANFESLAASIPPKDDDAIEATLAGRQTNSICFIGPDRDVLCLGTEGGEYLMRPQGSEVLTPGNVSFLPQSDKGAMGGLGSVRAGSSLLFVQRGGDVVLALSYSFQADRYEPQDVSLLAGHLLRGYEIVSWDYQQKPHSVVWMARSDGKLLGMTYMQEHEVIAWHQHETDGNVEAVAVMPSAPADQDLLWLIVRRNGVRQIEIMHPWFESDDKDTAYFVDGGASYFGPATDTLSGLEHLEGRTVSLFTDGYVMPPRVVKNGKVTLDRAVNTAHVGLPYTSTLIPTRPELNLQQGSTLMAKRRIIKTRLRVYQTLGLRVGLVDSFYGPQLGTTNLLSSPVEYMPNFISQGDMDIELAGAWDDAAALCMSVDEPTPATILACVSVIEL